MTQPIQCTLTAAAHGPRSRLVSAARGRHRKARHGNASIDNFLEMVSEVGEPEPSLTIEAHPPGTPRKASAIS